MIVLKLNCVHINSQQSIFVKLLCGGGIQTLEKRCLFEFPIIYLEQFTVVKQIMAQGYIDFRRCLNMYFASWVMHRIINSIINRVQNDVNDLIWRLMWLYVNKRKFPNRFRCCIVAKNRWLFVNAGMLRN